MDWALRTAHVCDAWVRHRQRFPGLSRAVHREPGDGKEFAAVARRVAYGWTSYASDALSGRRSDSAVRARSFQQRRESEDVGLEAFPWRGRIAGGGAPRALLPDEDPGQPGFSHSCARVSGL